MDFIKVIIIIFFMFFAGMILDVFIKSTYRENKHVIRATVIETGVCTNSRCGIKVKMDDGSIEEAGVNAGVVIDQIVYKHCYANIDNKVICEDFYRTQTHMDPHLPHVETHNKN